MLYVDGHGDPQEMTLPDERYRAVKWAEQLLRDLCDPSKTPRVPKEIRQRAAAALRHYPSSWDMQRAARACPEVFVERYEDLHKFILQGAANSSGELDLEARQPLEDHEGWVRYSDRSGD